MTLFLFICLICLAMCKIFEAVIELIRRGKIKDSKPVTSCESWYSSKSSVKVLKAKSTERLQVPRTGSFFPICYGLPGTYYCWMVTSHGWYQEMWRLHTLESRSLFTPCCSTQEEMLFPDLHQTPSMPLLSEADVVWIWCVFTSSCLLTQWLAFGPTFVPTLFTSRMWNAMYLQWLVLS